MIGLQISDHSKPTKLKFFFCYRSKLKEEARKLKKEIKANSKSDKKEQEKDDQKGLLMFIMFFSRKYLT